MKNKQGRQKKKKKNGAQETCEKIKHLASKIKNAAFEFRKFSAEKEGQQSRHRETETGVGELVHVRRWGAGLQFFVCVYVHVRVRWRKLRGNQGCIL